MALAVLTARHIECWTLGSVKKAKDVDAPRAVLLGDHPRF
jgi:phosphoribosylformylglycinamidine cyclo-ligase